MSNNQQGRIREAEITHRKRAVIGDRVKHMGQRFTDSATATILGFRATSPAEGMRNTERPGEPWIKVIVRPDNPEETYGRRKNGTWEWDWDRTQLR